LAFFYDPELVKLEIVHGPNRDAFQRKEQDVRDTA
jgi:hypothetical protein